MRLLFLALLLVAAQSCSGGARHFTFLYEAPVSPAGSIELENYATASFDGQFRQATFRHELEIGVTERVQVGIYVGNWNYEEGTAHYNTASVETIYNLSSPVDWIGVSLYQEISAGRRSFESESKLILQKNLGPLILCYNLTLEAEWSGQALRENSGELQQGFGVSYELHPRLSVGAELLHEIILPEWRAQEGLHNVFVGPNVSWRSNFWFATLSAVRQITSTEDEPDYQVRLIFGLAL